MDWIKLENSLPEFERVVLLYGKINNKPVVTVGWLQSIGKNGANFTTDKDSGMFQLFDVDKNKNKINVTHWLSISPP